MGATPPGWGVDRIRNHLDPIVGGEWGEDPNASDDGIEIPVVRVANISGLDVAVDELTLRRVKESKLSGRIIGARSLLIEKSGGGEKQAVGRVVLGRKVPNRSICSNFMAKADCGSKVDPLFVAYLLNSAYSSGLNEAHIQQTTGIQNLRVADYLNTHLAIPPLPEQRAIAAHLDRSCAAIDAAIAAKRGQIESLNTLRRSRIEKAITAGLNHAPLKPVGQDWLDTLPEHWQAVRIKRLLQRMDYGISVSTEPEGRYPVLKMGHLSDGEITFKNLDYVDDVSDELLLEEGDLLYNRTNSPDQVGKAAIFRKARTEAVTFASYLVRLRVNHRMNAEFLNYVLNSDGFLGYARRLAIPSVQQSNLNSTRYGRMLVPVPPIDEQREIVLELNMLSHDIRRTQDILAKQIDTLLAYRKSLIHECVTGMRRLASADFSPEAAA